MFKSIINYMYEFYKDVEYTYIIHKLKKSSHGKKKKLKDIQKYLTKWLDINEIPYDNYNVVIVNSIDDYVGVIEWRNPPRGLAKFSTREIILDINRIEEDSIAFNQPIEIMLIIYVLHEARHAMQYKYVENKYGKEAVRNALELNNSLPWYLSDMEIDATEYSKNFVFGTKYETSVKDIMEKFIGSSNNFQEAC